MSADLRQRFTENAEQFDRLMEEMLAENAALRERAEAAERKAGDLQHLADGAMRFKLRQFVRIRKLEAALQFYANEQIYPKGVPPSKAAIHSDRGYIASRALARQSEDGVRTMKGEHTRVEDTDQLRYLARGSSLPKESCQLCEDAADEIDELRERNKAMEQDRDTVYGLFKQRGDRVRVVEAALRSLSSDVEKLREDMNCWAYDIEERGSLGRHWRDQALRRAKKLIDQIHGIKCQVREALARQSEAGEDDVPANKTPHARLNHAISLLRQSADPFDRACVILREIADDSPPLHGSAEPRPDMEEALAGWQEIRDYLNTPHAQMDPGLWAKYMMIMDQVKRAIRASRGVPEAVRAVMDELQRARAKFPQWPDDPIHAAAVVQEEAGELVQAALQDAYEPDKATLNDAHEEARQTAAMAIRWMQNYGSYVPASTAQHDDRAIAEADGEGPK